MSKRSKEMEDPTSSGGDSLAPAEDIETHWGNLLSAISENKIKEVRRIIKHCPDLLFTPTEKNEYLLEICLTHYKASKDSLNYLLGRALRNKNTPDKMLWDLWVKALAVDRSDLIEKIIPKKREYVLEFDEEGRTNIDICVSKGSAEVLRVLLAAIEVPEWVNRKSNDKNTPISRVVEEFLAGNITEEKAIELATLLFDHGAFPRPKYLWREKLSENSDLYELFHVREQELIAKFEEALILEETHELKKMLDLNRNLLYAKYGEEGRDLLGMFCVTNNKYVAFKWILENYLSEEINHHDYTQGGARTYPPMIYLPLDLFTEHRCTEETAVLFAQLMINNGADVSIEIELDEGTKNWKAFTDPTTAPKLYALYEKYDKGNPGSEICKQFYRNLLAEKTIVYTDVKKALENNEALINGRDDLGRNALHIAIERRDVKLFNLFLNYRFKNMTQEVFDLREDRDEERDYYQFHFDALDIKKRTPLLLAIELAASEKDAVPYVCELLKKGADPTLTTMDGIGPLHRAAAKGYSNIVKALIASAIIGFPQREFRDVYGATQKLIQLNVVDAGVTDSLGMNLLHYAMTHGEIDIFEAFKHGHVGSYDFNLVELCFQKDQEGHTPFYVGLNQKDLEVRKKVNVFIVSLKESMLKIIGDLTSSPRLKRSKGSEQELSEGVSASEEPTKKSPIQKLQHALTKLAKCIEIHPDPKHEFQKRRNEKAGLLSLTILALLYELQSFPLSLQKSLSFTDKGWMNDSVDSTNSVMQTIEDEKQIDHVNKVRKMISNFLSYSKSMCADLETQKKLAKVVSCAAKVVARSRGLDWIDDLIGNLDGESGEGSVEDEEDALEPKLCAAIREMQDEKMVLAYMEELSDKEKRRGFENKDTPLHIAADKGYATVIGHLVNHLQVPAADEDLDQKEALQYYAKNSLGMNFLHNAFRNGNIHIAREFMNDDYYDMFFGFLVRQKDNEGDTPIYVGMTSKHPIARQMTQAFFAQLITNVNSKVNNLERELEDWESPESVLHLKSVLKSMMKRIRTFEKPKIDLLKRHNVDAALVYLTVLDLVRNMRELSQNKNAANSKDEAEIVLNSFIQNAKDATVDDTLIDYILMGALVALALVAGVTIGILIGALIAYLSGISAVVFLGLGAFELAGGCVLGVVAPAGAFIAAQLCLFGFRRDINETRSIVNDILVSSNNEEDVAALEY